MGMYTGLRTKIVVKEEYTDLALHIASGEEWDDLIERYPFVGRLADLPRGEQVPRWSISYMPDEWGDYNVNRFDSETREWEMIFSIKNYDDEIGCFMHDILTRITEKVVYMYTHYEEWDIEKRFTISNGELRFVDYLDIYTRQHRNTPAEPRKYGGWGY